MITESGRQAVWQHAQECGIADDIKQIAKFFEISEVNIFANGKFTYINDKLRKMIRVPAHPSPEFFKGTAKEAIKDAKQQTTRLKR